MRKRNECYRPRGSKWKFGVGAAALCGLVVVLGGCGKEAGFQAPPPPTVTAATPVQESVTVFGTFTGKTVAIDIVQIRARVSGYLEQMKFTEGGVVQQGELLYVIEQDQYLADLSKAKADVDSATADYEAALTKYNLIKEAFEQEAASKKELIEAQSTRDQAKAQIAVAESEVTQANINLGYTEIHSPSTGRIAKTEVDVGNLVGHGDATLLTTVVTFDPMYVYFTINQRDLLLWLEKHPEASRDPEKKPSFKVWLETANDVIYPTPGLIDYASPQVDPETGTTTLRAIVPNPDDMLYPGLFMRVKAPNHVEDALLVPQVALQRDMQGSYLMKVVELSDKDKQQATAQMTQLKDALKGTPRDKGMKEYTKNYTVPTETVQRINVTLGPQVGDFQVIASGLEKDDRIIVDGLQRARPGQPLYIDSKELTAPKQINDPSPDHVPQSSSPAKGKKTSQYPDKPAASAKPQAPAAPAKPVSTSGSSTASE